MGNDAENQKAKRPVGRKRPTGPNIRMTDFEYAHTVKLAGFAGKKVSTFLRELALSDRSVPDYSDQHISKLRRVGQRFNNMVHKMHINPEISTGRREPGVRHYDDVSYEVHLVEEAILELPAPTWFAYSEVGRGEGKRIRRGRVWCTVEEHADLKERADSAGLSQEAFVRAVALGRPIGAKSTWRMINQLERIENNLAQLQVIREWDVVMAQTIHLCQLRINRRIKEASSGRRRGESI